MRRVPPRLVPVTVVSLAAVPLVIDMLVAIASTKVPLLLREGFWKMAHESRTDWAMLLGALFLLTERP